MLLCTLSSTHTYTHSFSFLFFFHCTAGLCFSISNLPFTINVFLESFSTIQPQLKSAVSTRYRVFFVFEMSLLTFPQPIEKSDSTVPAFLPPHHCHHQLFPKFSSISWVRGVDDFVIQVDFSVPGHHLHLGQHPGYSPILLAVVPPSVLSQVTASQSFIHTVVPTSSTQPLL